MWDLIAEENSHHPFVISITTSYVVAFLFYSYRMQDVFINTLSDIYGPRIIDKINCYFPKHMGPFFTGGQRSDIGLQSKLKIHFFRAY